MSSAPASAAGSSEDRIQEEAAAWFARLRGEDISFAERAEFDGWLAADERHRREYALFEQLWATSAQLRPQVPQRRRILRTLVGFFGVVAVCGWLGWAWTDSRMVTATGESRHVRLADGSQLVLAPETRLRVRFDGGLRRLELTTGKIAVAVADDPSRPFEIIAGSGIIRDIGTRFEVDVHREQVHVTVAEGRVEIALADSGNTPRQVGAGETVEFDARSVSLPRAVDAAALLAWTRGQLTFDAVPLADVVAALNRYRKTPIVLADPSLAAFRISGVFLIDEEAATLSALENVAPVTFVRRGTRIEGWHSGSKARPAP